MGTLIETAREIARTVTAKHTESDDREARWPEETMRALASAGLTGLQVPRSLGGHGQGMVGLVAISEIIAQESGSAGLCFAMHCVGTAVLAAKATDYHRERYLRPIARGEHLTTLALSEPGTGSFFYVPETKATRVGDEIELTGIKGFVTNGGHADSYIVSTAPFSDEGEEGQFNCVVLEKELPGESWDSSWGGFGMRSNESRTLRLNGVRIPGANLLGDPGDELWYMFEVVAPYFLMAMAGTYLGVAQAAFDEARNHVATRRYSHSGELLGAAPVISHRIGELWTTLEATRQLIYSAAAKGDAGSSDALSSILACKASAADTAVTIANEAMTLCGGSAYRDNGRLSRILRDARASHVMAPTTDILKTWLGRSLLDLPLL
ncbi:MAG: acyl-CoA/acyl-ACP dehydrogenase [Gemmatimonadaceae bacterium]|nr:acyl-CoA/acyl-ACP dehydrogenase [Gemmatimonadaceae bacterium]